VATNLILRNTVTNGVFANGIVYYDMLVDSFGTTIDTGVVDTVASGTEIQWTKGTVGDAEIQWISGRVPAGGFTLTDVTAIQIWCEENNMSANCGARARFFKRTAAGTESELGGGPFNDGVEFGFGGPVQMDWVANVTDTAFAEDDRLLLKVYITNVGTMGSGFTCTLTFNGASGATGDSLITIAETVAFKANDVPAAGTDVLLLHCNGTDASTTFTDSSPRVHTIGVTGNVQIDTAQSMFGGASALFDGTGDRLRVTDNLGDFVFGFEAFTIDFRVRFNAINAQYNLYDANTGMQDVQHPVIYIATNNTLRFFSSSDRITGTTTVATGQWYHVALTRDGSGNTRLFLNGTQEGSTFVDGLNYYGGLAGTVEVPCLGSDPTTNFDLNGWMDEIRVRRGQAVWTSNFTPPTTEYPLSFSFVFTPNSYLLPLIVR